MTWRIKLVGKCRKCKELKVFGKLIAGKHLRKLFLKWQTYGKSLDLQKLQTQIMKKGWMSEICSRSRKYGKNDGSRRNSFLCQCSCQVAEHDSCNRKLNGLPLRAKWRGQEDVKGDGLIRVYCRNLKILYNTNYWNERLEYLSTISLFSLRGKYKIKIIFVGIKRDVTVGEHLSAGDKSRWKVEI